MKQIILIGILVLMVGCTNAVNLVDIDYNNLIIAKTSLCIMQKLDGDDYCPCVKETIQMMENNNWPNSDIFRDGYIDRKKVYERLC